MKIEKISDNQIKCTLTRSDLASRQLKLSELAYGTEKAKGLFQDMMEQASLEFGFETADLPLVIEAIPVSMDCIILMITRVENPEEVDARFSVMAGIQDLMGEEDGEDSSSEPDFTGQISTGLVQLDALAEKLLQLHKTVSERLFSFGELSAVIDYAKQIRGSGLGKSALYKSPEDGKYYLHLCADSKNSAAFSRICDSALEYGSRENLSAARVAYMNEHFTGLLPENAVESLAEV